MHQTQRERTVEKMLWKSFYLLKAHEKKEKVFIYLPEIKRGKFEFELSFKL